MAILFILYTFLKEEAGFSDPLPIFFVFSSKSYDPRTRFYKMTFKMRKFVECMEIVPLKNLHIFERSEQK